MISRFLIKICILSFFIFNCSITSKASLRDYSGVKAELNDPFVNPDKTDLAGNTALHFAAMNLDIEMAKLLLEKKANPNLKNSNGNTPLLILAKLEAENKEMFLELLLNNKANPNLVDLNGRAPLHYAVKDFSKLQVEMLLKFGSDINLKDNYNYSPFELANKGNEIYQIFKKNSLEKNENGSTGFTDIVILKNGVRISGVSASTYENFVIMATKEGKISFYKSNLVKEIKKGEDNPN